MMLLWWSKKDLRLEKEAGLLGFGIGLRIFLQGVVLISVLVALCEIIKALEK